jgi:nucleoid DNA-binding protein
MTTAELVDRVAHQTGLSPGLVRKVLASLLGTLGDAMQRGEPVVLDRFGRFAVRPRLVSRRIAFVASPQLLARVPVR